MRVEIIMAELSAAYVRDLTPSLFSNALFRDRSKISLYYHHATDVLSRPFQLSVRSRFGVKSTAAPRRSEEIPVRDAHPEILGFNCAPDISAG